MRRCLVAILAIVAVTAPPSGSAGPAVGPVPAGFRPASVTFVSASLGWVLGTAPCGHPPCTSIVRTRDGGHTWQGIPAPRTPLLPSSESGQRGVRALRFANARDGWAFGTELWATHDGGATWQRIALSVHHLDVVDLEAGGGKVWALIGSQPAGGGLAQGVRVYSAAVGSDHWRVGPAMVGGYELVVHGHHAWVLTEFFTPLKPILRLFASAGGGWHRRPVPCRGNFAVSEQLAASSASHLLLVCGDLPGAGSQVKRAYVSTNGGRSWTRRGAPSRGGDLYSAASPAPAQAFVAAASGASLLYGSFDGARHWHNVLTLDDGGLGWTDLGFTTTAQGVAIEGRPPQRSKLWMTRDGGHHWSPVTF